MTNSYGIPEHGKYLACTFRIGTSLVAMELSRYFLKGAVPVGTEELPHFELVIGARSSRRRFGGTGSGSSTYLAIFVSVHHLAPFSEAGILCVFGGKRVPLHGVLLLV